MQKLESNWKTTWGKKLGTYPHNEKDRTREARKQKLAEAEEELLSISGKRDCGDKAKRIKSGVD